MIKINNLKFSYKKKEPILQDINLELKSGSIYGLLGKNGSGKTSLLKLIMGLRYPQEGECKINDFSVKKRLAEMYAQLFFIPEEFSLPGIKIKTYETIYAPFYPTFNKEQFLKNLDDFELNNQLKLNRISHGEKKKFLIAFGLACNTKLIVLDEPTNGLDIPSKSKFRKMIAASMDESKCIIISTHQVRDLSNLIDHIVILNNHQVVFNQNNQSIISKIAFGKIPDENTNDIIYKESIYGSNFGLYKSKNSHTEVDLELLFNAVIQNNAIITNALNN